MHVLIRMLAGALGLAMLWPVAVLCMIIFGVESYNPIFPYADTEMRPGYTPEKFEKIHRGMSLADAEALLGQPLYKRSGFQDDSTLYEYNYTSDGELRRRCERELGEVPIVSDMAWYRSSIGYDSAGVIRRLDKGWSYD